MKTRCETKGTYLEVSRVFSDVSTIAGEIATGYTRGELVYFTKQTKTGHCRCKHSLHRN